MSIDIPKDTETVCRDRNPTCPCGRDLYIEYGEAYCEGMTVAVECPKCHRTVRISETTYYKAEIVARAHRVGGNENDRKAS